jgi:hypothetical protein
MVTEKSVVSIDEQLKEAEIRQTYAEINKIEAERQKLEIESCELKRSQWRDLYKNSCCGNNGNAPDLVLS